MEDNISIKIISEPSSQKPYAVIYKPAGIPSAPISTEDTNNALYQAIQQFPQLLDVKGRKEIEYGLLHRIDTPTEGLILIAATQDFYDYMQIQQQNDKFIKYYRAICKINQENSKKLTGFPDEIPDSNNNPFYITSYFRYFGNKNKEVRPVTKNSGKAALNKIGKPVEYTTEVQILSKNENTAEVQCKLSRGFKHQVRNHLAWIGLPIIGDNLYNFEEKDKKNAVNLKFTASKIQFYYPEGDLNSYEITPTST